jgi:hypothetical protein
MLITVHSNLLVCIGYVDTDSFKEQKQEDIPHTFRIILKATICSVLRHFALYTRPKEPSPIKPKTLYFSIV